MGVFILASFWKRWWPKTQPAAGMNSGLQRIWTCRSAAVCFSGLQCFACSPCACVCSVQVFQAPPTAQEPLWIKKRCNVLPPSQNVLGSYPPQTRTLWLPPIVQRHVSGDRQMGVWVWTVFVLCISSVQGVGCLLPEGRICSDRWRWWSKTSPKDPPKKPINVYSWWRMCPPNSEHKP